MNALVADPVVDAAARLERPLLVLARDTAGVTAAMLVADDGAVLWPQAAPTTARTLAGVAWGLALLAEGALGQSGLAPCRHLAIESAAGHLVLMPVEHGARGQVLCVQTGPDAMLGHVLWAARRCCDALRQSRTDHGDQAPANRSALPALGGAMPR